MKTKLLYLLVPLIFSGCLASMSYDNSKKLIGQLIEASLGGSLDVMIDLLKQGADVNDCDNYGNTALHWTAQCGHLDCVKALIEAKADVNARNNNGYTSLTWAAEGGYIGSVKALLEAKADVNARNNGGNTALHWAAQRGHLDCVKALIGAKADVNARNNDGETALRMAYLWGHLDCVKSLVKYSYRLALSKETVSESRKRICRVLGVFVGLRNQHSRLAGLQDTTLQYEILSWDRCLQEDLVVILLDELTKGKDIKNVALIRSKEAAVSYLAKKVKEMVPRILDGVEKFDDLIKEGLDERIDQLKSNIST